MKLKTSITIITGCLVIFLFIMLPVFLSMEKKKDEIETKFQGSEFSLIDVNNENITETSFQGSLTAIFFGFTNCPDICPMTLHNLDLVLNSLDEKKKEKFKVFFVSIDPERDKRWRPIFDFREKDSISTRPREAEIKEGYAQLEELFDHFEKLLTRGMASASYADGYHYDANNLYLFFQGQRQVYHY